MITQFDTFSKKLDRRIFRQISGDLDAATKSAKKEAKRQCWEYGVDDLFTCAADADDYSDKMELKRFGVSWYVTGSKGNYKDR